MNLEKEKEKVLTRMRRLHLELDLLDVKLDYINNEIKLKMENECKEGDTNEK